MEDAKPTAHDVALAIVAAARVLGENPLKVEKVGHENFRFLAAFAIKTVFPNTTWRTLARFVGLNENGLWLEARVASSCLKKWWTQERVERVVAAVVCAENKAA